MRKLRSIFAYFTNKASLSVDDTPSMCADELAGAIRDDMPDAAVPCEKRQPIVGITESDWIKVYNKIVREYGDAKARQKNAEAAPSAYMKGLAFAIEALETIRPYNIAEVQ